ncbi:MAG TPA: hypothetical protein ENI95_10800 [Chloroflexi bacterium]|nr:hypothetical protein [Chloroflexota bacterium]
MSPRTIDRYEIIAEIGRGGMATVYRARDPRFGREVAIKVLPRELLHERTFRARFEREAQVIATLEHPAIVPVYDYGEEEGQPYLVMRYMSGGSLADRIRRGPFSISDAAHVFSQLAPALDRAHSLGIIHRDLKPGNILFDRDGNAYLADFGIAKLIGGTATLTGSGGLIGTPSYMSPEQVEGNGELDNRSDIYALGVILFEMLTGQTPYQADTPMRMAVQHVLEPVPSVLAVRADLPPGCEAVIRRAMAKNPDDRYQTAVELAHDLDALAQGQEIAPPADLSTLIEPATPVGGAYPAPPPLPETGVRGGGRTGPSRPAQEAHPAGRGGAGLGLALGGGVAVLFVVALLAAGGYFLLLRPSLSRSGEPTVAPDAAGELPSAPSPTPATAEEPAGEEGEVGETEPATPADESPPAEAPEASPTPWRNAQGYPLLRDDQDHLMVRVPAGTFTMGGETGYARDLPAHQVTLTYDYWIDVFEVTNGQYLECVTSGPCYPPQRSDSYSFEDYFGNPVYADHPVIWVTWFQADTYCRWRDARLPTEAEWEYAARGPDGRIYPWGNSPPDCTRVNYAPTDPDTEWCVGDTMPVGSYPTGISPFGVHDMSGNVWEWVADWFGSYSEGPQTDPTGPPSGTERVERSGSLANPAYTIRPAHRLSNPPDHGNYGLGFRCVRSE